jgi:hypothetical protein
MDSNTGVQTSGRFSVASFIRDITLLKAGPTFSNAIILLIVFSFRFNIQ